MGATLPIIIELDEDAPIKSLKLLHRIPGLANIHFNFDAFDKPKITRIQKQQLLLSGPDANGADGFSPGEALIKLFASRGKDAVLTRKEIRTLGGENGARMLANVGSLMKSGKLKKVGPAQYALGDATAAEQKPAVDGMDIGVLKKAEYGADLVLLVIDGSKEGIATTKQMSAAFESVGRSPRSINDQISKLLKAKKIKRVAGTRGSYVRA